MKSAALATFAVFAILFPLSAGAQDTGRLASNHPSLLAAKEELDKADKEVADRGKWLEMQQQELSAASGMVAATPKAIRTLADHLQTEKEALEVEVAGAKGREDAITKAIEQTTARVRARTASDEVIKQLEAVVAVREKSLERVRHLQANAAISKDEVEVVEATLASARADLAVAKQKTSGPSNDLLEALNRELINLTISRQERAAKLEFIDTRLKQLAPALNGARNVERAAHELERAERHRDAAVEQLIVVQRPPGNQP